MSEELENKTEEVEEVNTEEKDVVNSIFDRKKGELGLVEEAEEKVVEEPKEEIIEESVEEAEPTPTAEFSEPEQPILTEDKVNEILEARLKEPKKEEPVKEEPKTLTQEELLKQIGYQPVTAQDMAFLEDINMSPEEKAAKMTELQNRMLVASLKANEILQQQELSKVNAQVSEIQQARQIAQQQAAEQQAYTVVTTAIPELKGKTELINKSAEIVKARLGEMPDRKPETVNKYLNELKTVAALIDPTLTSTQKVEEKTKKPPALSDGHQSGTSTKPAKTEEEKKPKNLASNILARRKQI